MRNKKLLIFLSAAFVLSGVFYFLKTPALASNINGTIDATDRYAWGENTGWIDFGTDSGNVHVTDAGLSGYALSENVGWINLDNVVNDGAGNLSGYAWSENTGFINFAPANGGVIISSLGIFNGVALSETVGWIVFGGTYAVKTDWRPQGARTYTLTYTAGANGIVFDVTPQTVTWGTSGAAVTAVPVTGYHFVDWSDALTQNPRTDTNVTGNITVMANFAINTYTLTYTAGSDGSITGSSPQIVARTPFLRHFVPFRGVNNLVI